MQRVRALEEQHRSTEMSIIEIKSRITSVDEKVTLINGGVLNAITEFRKAMVNQMKINQALLMREKDSSGEIEE
jgi:hypothetical protein